MSVDERVARASVAAGELGATRSTLVQPISLLRVLLALLLPASAFGAQAYYWDVLQPFAFFLIYPAIFCSALIGGRAGGSLATLLWAVAAWWYFLEPRGSFALEEARSVAALLVFISVGLGVSVLQGRLQTALAQARWSLDYADQVNRVLDHRVRERTDQLVLLAAIVESSKDAVVGQDLGGLLTSWNAAARELFGYDATEMIGSSLSRLIPLPMAGGAASPLARLRRGELVAAFDAELRKRDGSLVPVSISVSPIHDAHGALIGASVAARDISQRLFTERRLRESEARLLRMFDGMLEGCQIIDYAWTYRYVNESTLRMARLPRQMVLGRTMMDAFPGIEKTELFASLARCMRGRRAERFENKFEYGDGTWAWFDLSVQPAPDGLFVLCMDITARKKSEESARESDARFRQIAESLPLLIWTTTADGANDYTGKQWERYTGIPLAESHGHSWADAIHPEDLPQLDLEWSAAVKSGKDFHHEYRIRRHDGVYRWFDGSATAVRDSQGAVVKWFGSNTDIDDSRRSRGLQLRTQKMEALGTLAGGIAHDFNNILFAILGNTQLGLLGLAAEHPVRLNLEEVERASLRARDLVQRILAFSRQEEPKREVIMLQPVIEEAVKLLRATLPAIVALRTRCAEHVPATVADATQVHQIVMNLATNAAYAIGERPGVIEIGLDKIDADRALARSTPGLHEATYARLSVTDDGCGMSEHTLERIFDPFYTTKPVGQGTGLGLSVVDGIMKSHGGTVTVYSAPGKGTAFRLYFPATTQAVCAAEAGMESVPAGCGRRVLYVDDDAALVLLAERSLSVLGYVVTSCRDPREALEKVRAHPDAYDVVVSDLSMPWMSGNELARHLRVLRPTLPVIVTSGYVRPEDQAQADEAGVATVILKPNSVDALGRALGRLFATGAG